MQTLQKLNATWYERPQIVSIEAIKGAEYWALFKKDDNGNFFYVRPREKSLSGVRMPDEQIVNS